MKTLKTTDHVSIQFGEWFDKTYGNTYFDARIDINDATFTVPYRYGYHAPDKQAIDEVLEEIGYRVRTNNSDPHKPYRTIHVYTTDKLKRELYK